MSSNSNLQTAKNDKNDEFYTSISDIKKEVEHYNFKDKIVCCPCDTKDSMFTKYFLDNYDKLQLCGLTASGLGVGLVKFKKILLPLTETDCFSSKAELAISYSDVIVTNPPFSKFREFMDVVIKSGKQFLILGNLNAAKYKELFPLVKEQKMWLGYSHGSMNFRVPDTFSRDNVFEKDSIKYAKFGNICWFTNLPRTFKPLKLTKTYSLEQYPKYDTYAAIEVSKVKDIPTDYNDTMGVPVTFLQYHDPAQFEIIGELNHGCDNQYDFAKPTVNGKELFPRILIKRR